MFVPLYPHKQRCLPSYRELLKSPKAFKTHSTTIVLSRLDIQDFLLSMNIKQTILILGGSHPAHANEKKTFNEIYSPTNLIYGDFC